MQRGSGAHASQWRLDVVLLPGQHVYELLVDGQVEPPVPGSTRALIEHDGRQLYHLRINSRGLLPTVFTFRFPLSCPLERRVQKKTIKIRKKIVKEKIKKKSRPKAADANGTAAASTIEPIANGDEKKDDDAQVEFKIVERDVLIVPDETPAELAAREANEARWAAATKVQIRGSFTANQTLSRVLQNPNMKLLGPHDV